MKTAESVTPSHPDKLCDRISDAILDACLEQDPMSRVAIETMGGHGIITITGELTTKAYINAREIAQSIAGTQYGVQTNIVTQSPEIANGVDIGGAGDQGIMIGYACNDNEAMIPQELYLARSLAKHIYAKYPFDGKTQITLADDGTVATVVASFQNTTKQELHHAITEWLDNGIKHTSAIVVHANPAGDWNIGGFEADTGLTGRKLMVDNYGPQIPIGGGCFSGKDATKVDRSAAYMARQTAVTLLKAYEDSIEVTVKLAYAIGIAQPVMATAKILFYDDLDFSKNVVTKNVDLLAGDNEYSYKNQEHFTPQNIIKFLDLRKPQFAKTAEWGHFGNGFTWDK